MTSKAPNTFTPAQQHRLHFILDIFDGMEELDQARIEAGLKFARQGVYGTPAAFSEALIDLAAAPHAAAKAEGEWDGDPEAEACIDLYLVMGESVTIPDMPSQAVLDVVSERRRQIEVEDWTPQHDDEYVSGELVAAAGAYALEATFGGRARNVWFARLWPWHVEWWKPKDQRRDLVRAAALIIADIERIDRAAGKAEQAAANVKAAFTCDQCHAAPVVTNLDSDDLCQACATKWVKAEGAAAAEREADPAGAL